MLAAALGLAPTGPNAAVPASTIASAAAITAAATLAPADEVHVSWGPDGTSAVLHWRVGATALSYGTTTGYGLSATARAPSITPVDDPGPFREAPLTGLTPGTEYHYRIGAGPDRVFRTSPPPGRPVRWVDVGDTASTVCKPWMAEQHALIARWTPQLVTHGGDISYANDCGVPAVHGFYQDIQVWAANGTSSAAFMPVWGNHEYGPPTAKAPPGTPRDSLANYKGRSAVPNPQTVPADGAATLSAPGCPGPGNRNGCRGEDWGWFRAGEVLLISYPEPWRNTSVQAWRAGVEPVMAAAQADPTVRAVVTYGHRPPISSTSGLAPAAIRDAIASLADSWSPSGRPGGKYLLNLSHHIHGEEVFPDFHGIAAVVNGGGGTEQIGPTRPIAGSAWWNSHPAIAVLDHDPATRTLTVRLVCGVTIPGHTRDPCVKNTVLYRLDLAT